MRLKLLGKCIKGLRPGTAFAILTLLVSSIACQGKQRPFERASEGDAPANAADLQDAGEAASSSRADHDELSGSSLCEPGLDCEVASLGAACSESSRACNGANGLLECVDGIFQLTEICVQSCVVAGGSASCDNGCEPGAARCSPEGAAEACDDSRRWQLREVCEGSRPTCSEGRCVTCIPGTRECTPTGPATCDADGAAWIVEEPCTDAEPVCVPETGRCSSCSPGAIRLCPNALGDCASGQQTCGVDGTWGGCSVLPALADSCAPGRDENCNGIPNEGCDCTESVECGPAAIGQCQRGLSECADGVLGPCLDAVLPRARDCGSSLDNDCDGREDDELDTTCQCTPEAVEACDTHPGQDGIGICRAGNRSCVGTPGNTASSWSTCQGSVAPRTRDCRSNLDNDCNGTADNVLDSTCVCAPGTTRPCGPPQADGCRHLHQIERCEVLANGSSTRWGECAFIAADDGLCEANDLATGTTVTSVAASEQFAYFLDIGGTLRLSRVPARGGSAQTIAGPGLGTTLNLISVDSQAIFGNPNPTSVSRMPLIGDQFSLIAGSETDTHVITALRTNSTHLFTASVGSRTYFRRVPKGGGTRDLLIESVALRSDDFEVDDDFVYMLSGSDVSRISVGGGVTETVAVWEQREQAADLGIGPGYLALATSERIARASKAGGPFVTLSTGGVYRVATVGDSVYFFRSIAGGGNTCANGSELVRISQAGGTATVIAREPSPCVSEFAIGGNSLLWIASDRTVLRGISP